ncbi:helix-turn-helix domain-containing protein [Halorubrum vacuolatum]|uniref:Uncharacterized protein n=1 Tax=Halorubrum vacuolatum TaxID=63740 RepID=A0A238VE66_HALVU|nr:helix-turn-helix domain-containing protein [Halorubrum vacuolatum]SNR32700.1 hypothetical protein SAMN06264855_102343 [Halorubrum vacuolatum]
MMSTDAIVGTDERESRSGGDASRGVTEGSADSKEPSMDRTARQEPLRAELRVRRRDPAACPLVGDEVRTVDTQRLSCPDMGCSTGTETADTVDGPFDCRATVETDRGVEFRGRRTDAGCICPVFRSHDCVPSIEGVRRDEFVVSLTIPHREQLPAIVDALRDRGATVELRRIARIDGEGPTDRVTVEVDNITEKQRQALRVAVEEGYYQRPRGADLADIAERLGISRSAASQRLTGLEATLVEAVYDHDSTIGSRTYR